jgi:6-phosphogluconolactonase
MSARAEVISVADASAIASEGAGLVREILGDAAASRGRCAMALAGGRTPRGVYEALAETHAASIDWSKVDLWFGDERGVPPDHAESNARMAAEALTSRVPIPAAQVHRMQTEEADAARVAAAYEEELRRVFVLGAGEWPVFDLALLGMGGDGHTASLFPGTSVLDEGTRLASAVWVDRLRTWRVTLTYPVFNHARHVLVLVSGADKAEMLAQVLDGPRDLHRRPIQGIDPHNGRLTFLVDEPAAARLAPRG